MGKIYPEECKREAVELYRLGGTTYAAVARKLGVSGETVSNGGYYADVGIVTPSSRASNHRPQARRQPPRSVVRW